MNENIVLYFLFFLLILCVFIKANYNRNENRILLKNNSLVYKGLFSILIILIHLSHNFEKEPFFSTCGSQFVAVFFFISGYGIMKNYILNTNYYYGFFKKRILKVLIPYCCVSLLYYLFNITYIGFDYQLRLFNLEPTAMYCWYIVEILVIYIIFYFLMLVKTNKNIIPIIYFVLYILFFLYCERSDLHLYLFESTPTFIVGLIFALFEQKLTIFIRKRYYLTLVFILVCYFVCILYDYYQQYLPFNLDGHIWFYFPFVGKNIFFVMIMLLINMKLSFGNKILYFLGNISFYTYMLQGLVLSMIVKLEFVNNNIVLSIMVIASTITLSYLFSLIFNKMNKILVGNKKKKT